MTDEREHETPEKPDSPERQQKDAPEDASPEQPSAGDSVGTPKTPPCPQPVTPAPAEPLPSPEPGDTAVGLEAASGEKLNRRVLFVLLGILALALLPVFSMFLVPLTLASTLTTLFYPLYQFLFKRLGGRKALSSFVCCVILLLVLLIPAYLLIHLVALQTIDLYNAAGPIMARIVDRGENGLLSRMRDFQIVRALQLDRIDWQSSLQEAIRAAGTLGTLVINRTSTGVFQLAANVSITLFTMFYFFMDGQKLVQRLLYLSPLRREYEQMIFSRFLMISRATIKGTVLIGLMQGSMGGAALLVFGVKTWLLWGFVMVILSIVPMVGAWLVMIPAAIIQMALGNVWQGIGILLVSTLVISNIDNLLRPRLVGHDAKMHDLVIFFSTLGGIAVFGIMGFIVGPVITALFITVLDMYAMEYKTELTAPHTDAGKEDH